MKPNLKKIFIIVTLLLILAPLFQVRATDTNATPINANTVDTNLENPLGEVSVPGLIGNIIKVVLGFTGAIALLMFIYGGLTWMTSGGNQNKIKQGKDTLIWATIGLLVIFSSYAILKYVFNIIHAG